MYGKLKLIPFVVVALLLLAACKPESNMPNPASEYCEENDGALEIRTDDTGSQVGYCVFEDGIEYEEWAFYRGECQPSEN